MAYYSARSGLALAELLISKSAGLQGSELDAVRAEQERWYESARSLAEGGFIEITHELPVEEGEVASILYANHSGTSPAKYQCDCACAG
jgi:hypothetical protein